MPWFFVLLALATVACAPTGPRWVGENIHAVDGYWVDTETPCLPGDGTDCMVAVLAASRSIPAADAQQVVAAWIAQYPTSYVDSSGNTILTATGGMFQPTIVILDMADGRRRVVTQLCRGAVTTGGGAVVERPTCMPGELQNLRVDRQPGIGP